MKRGNLYYLLGILLILLPVISSVEVCTGNPYYRLTEPEYCSEFLSSNYGCSKASDGDFNTDWFGRINSPEPKWVYGDLGVRRCISGLRARLRGDDNYRFYPQTMNIQVSDNAVDWTTIRSSWTINKVNAWEYLTVTEVKARYVRFWITDCNCYVESCFLRDCDWEFSPNCNYCNFQDFEILRRNISDICVPDCTNKECGSDGCTGTCPPGCSAGETCNNGICVSGPDVCLSNNDIILKLSAETNAHAGLWNDANYQYNICYSDIFGTEGGGNRVCSGNNKILGLSANTNAHVEKPELNNYPTNLCYSNLICESVTDPSSCPADYEVVARIKQATNSHISAESGSYPIKICCYTPSQDLGEVYWANMLGQPITKAQIGDTVLMIYTGTDATTFEIKEEDLTNDDNIKTGQNAITGNIINNKAVAKFIITQQDFDLGFADELDSEAEFYFQIDGETSGLLTVQQNNYSNTPPTIQIIKPILNQKSKIQSSISFEQIAKDEDDDLKITWNFGDGASETYSNCLTGTSCNATHSYSDSGTKAIIATAEEMTRSQKNSKTTQILLYKSGVNLFPIITSPPPGTIIQGTQTINFNASSSFVAECSSVSCPGASCYNVGDLQCYDYPKTGIPSQYNLWFNWTFSEGLELIGNWTNNYNQVVEFTKTFYNAKRHWAKLKLGYEASPIQWSSDAYTDFEIISSNPQCTIEDDASYWRYWDAETGTLVTEPVINEDANCYNPNGQPTTCCPNNWGECITDRLNSSFGKCAGLPAPFLCSDYNAERYGGDLGRAETACENSNLEVAKRSISRMVGKNNFCGSVQSKFDSSTGQTCWWLITNCRCEWDSAEDQCVTEFSRTNSNCQGGPSSDTGTCTFNALSQTGNCETDDFTTYTWDAQWSGPIDEQPPECTSQTKSFVCEQNIKLPFFTFFNFITTLIVIALIYGTLIIREENRGN